MQPTRRIADDQIRIPRLARRNRIENNSRRVCALAVLDDLHTGTVRPDFKLLNCSGAEGIRRRQNHLFALRLIVGRHLADGGRFAYSVYPDYQDHRWDRIKLHPLLAGEHVGHNLPDHPAQLVRFFQIAFFHAVAQLVDDVLRRCHAHIAHDEDFFQLLKKIIVNCGARFQHGIDCAGHLLPRLF